MSSLVVDTTQDPSKEDKKSKKECLTKDLQKNVEDLQNVRVIQNNVLPETNRPTYQDLWNRLSIIKLHAQEHIKRNTECDKSWVVEVCDTNKIMTRELIDKGSRNFLKSFDSNKKFGIMENVERRMVGLNIENNVEEPLLNYTNTMSINKNQYYVNPNDIEQLTSICLVTKSAATNALHLTNGNLEMAVNMLLK